MGTDFNVQRVGIAYLSPDRTLEMYENSKGAHVFVYNDQGLYCHVFRDLEDAMKWLLEDEETEYRNIDMSGECAEEELMETIDEIESQW